MHYCDVGDCILYVCCCLVRKVNSALSCILIEICVKELITFKTTAGNYCFCLIKIISINDAQIREICKLDSAVRLVITLGYAASNDSLRTKKRKDIAELVNTLE